jgi:hypothetical protein
MSAIDAVDGSSTGIAMCRIAAVVQELQMTVVGTQQPVSGPPIYGCCQG